MTIFVTVILILLVMVWLYSYAMELVIEGALQFVNCYISEVKNDQLLI